MYLGLHSPTQWHCHCALQRNRCTAAIALYIVHCTKRCTSVAQTKATHMLERNFVSRCVTFFFFIISHAFKFRKTSPTIALESFKGKISITRSLGALWAPTSSWRPIGPLDFVLRALRVLRPCDPSNNDWIVC